MCVEVIVCYISVGFLRHSVQWPTNKYKQSFVNEFMFFTIKLWFTVWCELHKINKKFLRVWEEVASPKSCTVLLHFPQRFSPFSWGDLDPHLIHYSFGPSDPPSQTTSRSILPFFQNIRSLPTERRTDRQTERTRNSTCINRVLTLYLKWATRPMNTQVSLS